MANFPGPGEIRLFYTVDTIQHVQRINCVPDDDYDVGEDSANILLVNRDTTTTPFETAVDEWIALLQPFYNMTDAAFVRAEFWTYPPLSTDGVFRSVYDIGEVGTVANETVPAAQYTITFRTAGGGGMRVVLLESILGTNLRTPVATIGGDVLALAVYVTALDSWVYARDNTYPVVALNGSGGQNEALWRRRYRN